MFRKVNLEKNKLLLAYKLLADALVILLVFFVLSLMAEGVLPGIVSDHFGLYKIAFLTIVGVLALTYLGRVAEIKPEEKHDKKTAFVLLFVATLLIFNSLIKINILLNIIILVAVGASGYLIYKLIFED